MPVFAFASAPVPVRSDLPEAFRAEWTHLAAPGAVLTSAQRISIAHTSRTREPSGLPEDVDRLAVLLYQRPEEVTADIVRGAADASSDAVAVETIGIVSRLSAVDGFHKALGLALEPLPEPVDGEPTGQVDTSLKRRRTHVPVAPGPIPNTLDHVPAEGRALEAIHGPLYMAYGEMVDDRFHRTPGLNRAQMELVSSAVSLHNECFY